MVKKKKKKKVIAKKNANQQTSNWPKFQRSAASDHWMAVLMPGTTSFLRNGVAILTTRGYLLTIAAEETLFIENIFYQFGLI